MAPFEPLSTVAAPIVESTGSAAAAEQLTSLPTDFWIVIAAYNEQRWIGRVLDGLAGLGGTIVVVDDGSADNTAGEVKAKGVWLLRHAVNLGQGAALQTGIRFALERGARHVATFDADGQHDPSDLPKMYAALATAGADYALGSRFLGTADGIPGMRRLTLKLAVLFTRIFSGVMLSDAHNGIRVFTRRGAQRLRITFNRMEHASEIIDQVAASGLKFIEVPVRISYSRESLAKGQKSSAAIKLAVKLVMEKLLR